MYPNSTFANMESNSKSFLLETPFPHSSKFHTFSSKPSIGYASSVKSSCYTADGTFADVVEYNKHLTALKDLEKLKEQHYDDYVENLERKVLRQRKNIKTDIAHSDNSTKSKPKTKKFPKLQHHKLRHDEEYVRKVSKSKYYHLIAARDMMKQRGLIKSKNEEDIFWSRALHDSDLWSNPLPTDVPPDILNRLIVDRFSSRHLTLKSNLRKRRTVTFNETPTKSCSMQNESNTSIQKVDPNLLRFKVKLDPPKLHSMKKMSPLPSIEPKPGSLPESPEKIRLMNKFRSVQHAYDVAMVNHAAAHQMLKHHGLSPDDSGYYLLNNPTKPNTSIDKHKTSSIRSKSKAVPTILTRGKDVVFITEPVYGHDAVLIPELEYKYPNQKAQKKKKAKIKSHSGLGTQGIKHQTSDLSKTLAADVTPLDYGMMLSQNDLKVKDATCLSSFWVNYITTSKKD